MEQEVSLIQMLDARERRVWHQQELLGAYGKPLVCFTMNIAGPVKDSPLIRRGFARGRQLLERQFLRCGIKPLKIDLSKAVTGPEAFLCAGRGTADHQETDDIGGGRQPAGAAV